MARLATIDTNLLLLLVVGISEESYIQAHKRLKGYTVDDFRRLTDLISQYSEIVVTPNVLSEASNLLVYIKEPAKSHIARVYAGVISRSPERYVPTSRAAGRAEFLRLGVTDSVLLEVAKTDIDLISVDFDLYWAALTAGYRAINFNHLRDL